MATDTEPAPFLLLSIRAEDEAADDEYLAMMRFAGLTAGGLRRIRLTHSSLGQIDLADWSGIILGADLTTSATTPIRSPPPNDVSSPSSSPCSAESLIATSRSSGVVTA